VWQFLYAPGEWSSQVYEGLKAWAQGVGLAEIWLRLLLNLGIFIVLVAFVLLNVMFLTWLERKIAGHIQSRWGPVRVGPRGLFQPVADAIKLLTKEYLGRPNVDNFIYFMSPLMMFVAAFMLFVAIPFAPGWVVADLDYGLLFVLAASGVGGFFVLVGGWASNSKYSLMGGMRAVAQAVGYEVPLILLVLVTGLMAGTFNLSQIVLDQQALWNVVRQPVAFLLFLVVLLAEMNRGPIDLEEAEQELVGGYMTEYSGMHFAMFYLGEYTHLLAGAALTTTLFLGGWNGPFLPPVIWFLLKTYLMVFIFMWIRWTFPRIRVEQYLNFNWKFVLPVALVNLGVTSLILVL